MSDNDMEHDGDGGNEGIGKDMVLELNFVPAWAREPPHAVKHEARPERRRSRWTQERGGERYDRASRRGPRPDRPGSGPRRQDRERQSRREPAGHDRGASPRGDDSRFRRGEQDTFARDQRPRGPDAPVRVRFLPDQKQVAHVIRQLRSSKRAYPLRHLALIFLNKPQTYYVKVEPAPERQGVVFFQCRKCGSAAMEEAALVSHALRRHLEDYFLKEELTTEPPAGEFVCVARCGMTGTLLGPPNHHSFNEKVQEVRDTFFPAMPMEEYRARIETVRDPERIEEWKEMARHRVAYKRRDGAEGEIASLSWQEAESEFVRTIVPGLIARKPVVTLASDKARELDDEKLLGAVSEAFGRESRFPRTIAFAMRAAFRHKNLHLFRVGRGMEFVTAVEPHPLNPDFAIESISEVLSHLQKHPGCTRENLVSALRPGLAPDAPGVAEVLSPFGWLIEKGHIIEFFDGTLAVPVSRRDGGNAGGRAGT